MANSYEALVTDVRKSYQVNGKHNSNLNLVWCDDNEDSICKEINLWTYWQGYNYAKFRPEIDYLLVGQDWGNPFFRKK